MDNKELIFKLNDLNHQFYETLALMQVLNDALTYGLDNNIICSYHYSCSEIISEKLTTLCDEFDSLCTSVSLQLL